MTDETYSPLLTTLFNEPDETLHAAVEAHLDEGQDVNAASSYGETPIGQAFRRGRLDVVALLAERGADLAPLGWNEFHRGSCSGIA